MALESEPASLSETAYAKVNLALHVRARRADGYHAIESLFCFADRGDTLVAQADAALSLVIDGPFAGQLTADPDNLVLRAARALQAEAGIEAGARLALTKRLPIASGIGGGSADAAAALRLLNRLWRLDLPQARLEAIGETIGSDVPACITSVTQRVEGRGEALTPAEVPGLAGKPMLLVNPGVAVSTGPVFAGWDGLDRGPLGALDLASLIEQGRNDLQSPAIAVCPAIKTVLEALAAQHGAQFVRMSGSGATCFALFEDDRARDVAAAALSAAQPGWWVFGCSVR